MFILQLSLLLLWLGLTADAISLSLAATPVVDLGYELHQATVNVTGGYYNFSNIRYGASTAGEQRFSPPQPPSRPPSGHRPVNNGQSAVVCPGALPVWLDIAVMFAAGLDYTHANTSTSPSDPRTSEDCLFLDLVVPKAVFDGKLGAPVLVWIHGGGFVSGHKSEQGNGAGLVTRSMEQDNAGIIYVAINYRLGLFGWLAGTAFEEDSGTPNVGLLDQRLALLWIQKYVHLFGGDPGRVTIMAESAGAGAAVLHIASASAARSAGFQQAILQSPWLLPPSPMAQQDALYRDVLHLANATTLSQLRGASTASLHAANSKIIAQAPYGTFGFGPTVDHSLVHGSPTSSNNATSSISLLVGHNSNEGILFTPPQALRSHSAFGPLLARVLPAASSTTLAFLASSLYRASKYADPVHRYATAYAEATVMCTARRLSPGHYAYVWSVPPGWHASDQAYTFYNGDGQLAGGDAGLAMDMQRYFVNFVAGDDPAGGPLRVPTPIPVYDHANGAGELLNFSIADLGVVRDDVEVGERCRHWVALDEELWR